MLLKQAHGQLTAWSNLKQYSYMFATASTLESQTSLQFHKFDLAKKDTSTQVLGEIVSQQPLTSISWDNYQLEKHPMGVMAGGTNDGGVYFWDVNAVLQNQDPFLSYIDQLYEGPVTTMEFNQFKPNLLALGGNDVLIMDIVKDIRNPSIYSPGDPNLHGDNTITSVSWNQKVQHILASASQNGLTVVWDLKINKSIFSFQDSSAVCNRRVSLSWNPEIPTQIAVTYDDERVPELQIWDLRNPQGPVVVFNQAHRQGINSLSWCPSDQSLILTGGRDGQVICWNYKTQSIVSQEQVDFDISDLHWSKKVNSIYSVSSESGTTQIKSMGGSKEGYAPKWYKPPVGGRFSGLGELATFKENNTNINLYGAVADDTLGVFSGFNKFMDADSSLDRIELEMDSNPELWSLLKATLKGDTAEYLQTFGFSPSEITQQTENYTGKRHSKREEANPKQQKVVRSTIDFTSISDQDAESFFDQLTTQSIKKEQQPKTQQIVHDSKETFQYEQVSKNTNWDAGVEKIIKDNLIIGNYEGAIDCALKCGRSAEALLLAYSQSKDIFEQTMTAFLTSQTDYFLKNVVKHIVLRQPEEIAKNYELNNWKECAAMVLSSDQNIKFNSIMESIGDRFLNEKKDESNALQCYILSKNADKCIQILAKHTTTITTLANTIKLLIFIEDIADIQSDEFSNILDKLIIKFAYKAMGHGQYLSAAHALQYSSQDSLKSQELFDLLYNGNHPQRELVQKLYAKPTFPFKFVQIKVQAKKQQPQSQPSQHQPHQIRGQPMPPPQPQQGRPNTKTVVSSPFVQDSNLSGTGAPPSNDRIPPPRQKGNQPPPPQTKQPPPPAPIPRNEPIFQPISTPSPITRQTQINQQLIQQQIADQQDYQQLQQSLQQQSQQQQIQQQQQVQQQQRQHQPATRQQLPPPPPQQQTPFQNQPVPQQSPTQQQQTFPAQFVQPPATTQPTVKSRGPPPPVRPTPPPPQRK